jgi:prevent-host-death family protein
MKTITATDLRSAPGERLTDIRRDGASFLITKSGKPIARLIPANDMITIDRDGKTRGEMPLTLRRDLGQIY